MDLSLHHVHETSMKILVIGSNGQLGRCLREQASAIFRSIVFTDKSTLDITDFDQIITKVEACSPDVVINASAFTAVDTAESFFSEANLVNHLAVENLADACRKSDSFLFHVSTDYVFDGEKGRPYVETDQTNPQTVYGATKLDGEKKIIESGCKSLIIRTSWVFSEHGGNFLKTMLRLGAQEDTVRVVEDQIGCPTYAHDIARTIITLLPIANRPFESEKAQILNYCGKDSCSWYGFASAIFAEAKAAGLSCPRDLLPVPTKDFPTKAKRPSDTRLDCSKINQRYGIDGSDWLLGVKRVVSSLAGPGHTSGAVESAE